MAPPPHFHVNHSRDHSVIHLYPSILSPPQFNKQYVFLYFHALRVTQFSLINLLQENTEKRANELSKTFPILKGNFHELCFSATSVRTPTRKFFSSYSIIEIMPRKGISAKTFPGLGKNSQEKQKSSIRWTKSETQLIVDWFCTRNEDGFRVNYDLWTTSSCSSAAERMMNQTGLVFKAGVTKKKAADRMIYMIKLYENLRNKIKQSEWSDGLDGVDGISHEDRKLQIGSYETAKEVILKRCAWYYEYEQLFCDYPGVNPLSLNESDQSTRRGFQVIKDFELGRYDEELEEGESWLQNYGESIACDQDAEEDAVPDNEDESDSFSFYSARSQYERDDSLAAKQRTKNTTGISDDKVKTLD